MSRVENQNHGMAVGTPVPMGASIDENQLLRFQLELERETSAAVSRLTSKFSALENKESQRFKASLEHTVQQAQARVADSARLAVEKQVGTALRTHLENSSAATEAVHDVVAKLEHRAEENASVVISRLAGESKITRAIEEKVVHRLDEKMRGVYLWTAIVPFLSTGVAVYFVQWWNSRK